MDYPSLREKFKAALSLEEPYFSSEDFPFGSTKRIDSAVLMLWKVEEKEPHLLLTKRTNQVKTHKGQMAFPGGVRNKDDLSLLETALRETEEEVNISPSQIEIIGSLPSLPTYSTSFLIHPFVGLLKKASEIEPHPEEIQATFWIRLNRLIDPSIQKEQSYPVGSTTLTLREFHLEGEKIWGATAIMIKNVLDRLKKVC